MKILIYTASILIILSSAVNAQVSQQWSALYNSPTNADDLPAAMTTDNSGNVYVTGRSPATSNGIDYATVKYNSAGEIQWQARYNNSYNLDDKPTGIAVDASGNVYVTGVSNLSLVQAVVRTIKYNSAGVQQWEARKGDSVRSSAPSTPGSIALDAGGNIYIGGVTRVNLSENGCFLLVKYTPQGDTVWSRLYDGTSTIPGLGSAVSFVKVQGNGVYVSGKSYDMNPNRTYVTTIKYDLNGDTVWLRQDSLTNGSDEVRGMEIDAYGNVILTYNFYMNIGVVKYSSDGNRLWKKFYTGITPDRYDEVTGIDSDVNGNIFITGNSDRNESDRDYLTLKFDPSGNLLWEKLYNGTGNNGDYANDVYADNSGNVYVTGTAYETGFHTNAVTIKYDAAGNQQWKIHFDGASNLDDDYGNFVRADNEGNVFVFGKSDQTGHQGDLLVIKYFQTTGIEPLSNNTPEKFSLQQNYPNPFNPETTIRFDITTSGISRMIVHDISGKEVETLFNEELVAGSYEVKFNGSKLTSGIYFYTLVSGKYRETRKMIVLK